MPGPGKCHRGSAPLDHPAPSVAHSPIRGVAYAFFPALILWGISAVVIWQLWIYRASVAAQFGWTL